MEAGVEGDERFAFMTRLLRVEREREIEIKPDRVDVFIVVRFTRDGAPRPH